MKKIMFLILLVVLLLAMVPSATAYFGEEEFGRTLKVGICSDVYPFAYAESASYSGFDIAFMRTASQVIGFGIEFVDMSYYDLLDAVESGEVDCAMSGIEMDTYVYTYLDYSISYLIGEINESYVIVFPKGSEYKDDFDNVIREFASDGTIDDLLELFGMYEYKCGVKQSAIAVSEPSEWALYSVEIANDVKITDSNKEYYYQDSITREEFSEMIYNLLYVMNPSVFTYSYDVFEDTDNEKILSLYSVGVINGKSSTEFAPEDMLTREEAATIIVRTINLAMNIRDDGRYIKYKDSNEISVWASEAVQKVSNLGIMHGVGDYRFAPKDTYTVEQAITTLVRIYDLSTNTKNNSMINNINIHPLISQ